MNIPCASSKEKSRRLTREQKDALIEVYQHNPYPVLLQKKLLSQSLKLSKTRIETWFSARRRLDRLNGKVLPLPTPSWRIRCGNRVFTGPQLQVLSQEYARNRYPSRCERTLLSQTLNVPTFHVDRWFQVRRSRDRKVEVSRCKSKASVDNDPIDLSKKYTDTADTKFGALDADSDDSSSTEYSTESDFNVPHQDEPSSSLRRPQDCQSSVHLQEVSEGQCLIGTDCQVSCSSNPPPLIPVQPATHNIPFNHVTTPMHPNTWVPSWNQPSGICQFTNFYPWLLPPSPYQYQFHQLNQFATRNVSHQFVPTELTSFNHSFASNPMSQVPVPSNRFNQCQ